MLHDELPSSWYARMAGIAENSREIPPTGPVEVEILKKREHVGCDMKRSTPRPMFDLWFDVFLAIK